MPSVTVRPGEPDEYVIPTTASPEGDPSLQYVREYQTTTKLLLDVPRDEAAAANLEKFDTVRVSGYPDHRVKTVQTGGQNWRIVAYSFEIDGRRDEPLSGGETFEGTDDTIITDLINRSSYWSVGTVQSLTGPLTYIFDDAFLHEALRRVEANTPGELRFNDDGSVDYVDSLGTDKSGTVTLSPDAENIDGPLAVVDDGQSDDMDATHIRVMGGHEGNARPRANLIPEDDPQTYENEIRYSTPLWTSSEDTEWGRWTNSDLTQQATLEEEANALADEITDPVIDVATGDSARHGVRGLDLALGDYVAVDKPDADIARPMRIHRIVDKIVGGVKRQAVELSTRTYARDTDRKRTRDIHRQNVGFQGSSVVVNGGPVFRAVDSGSPLSFGFRYPDLEFEDTAEIRLEGLQYRVDSNPTPHSHSFTVPDHDHGFTIDIPDHDHTVTLRAPPHQHDLNEPGQDSSLGKTFNTDTADGTDHDHIYEVSASLFSFEEDTETTSDGGGYFESATTDDGGFTSDTTDTEAGFEPGIFETTDTPSNVDVLINGQTVASNVGSGTFQEVVDVAGEFDNDAWNSVEIQSDSLGIVNATIYLEGYDQVSSDQ